MTRTTRTSLRRPALLGGVALTAGVALALGAPLAASAHVSATATSTAAGSYTVVTFSVGHGCDGSPTTGLQITIPEGINSVTPTINPNWDVTKNEVQLDAPITDSHGASVTERVDTVSYTAKTPLAEGYRDTVELQVQLPADAEGETLAFPVLQSCEVGSTDWSEATVEGEAEPELPAPTVTVTAAVAGSGHHDDDGDDDATATVADAAHTETTASGDDVLARILGIGGLVVGAVGIVIAASSRRNPKASA
ncbi:YcnI family protein [Microbacteriaceae bacterium VKM Ac-2855]|nr:YcnI family protein [Microbacteriaceae bacterium VKM Ac-2855]